MNQNSIKTLTMKVVEKHQMNHNTFFIKLEAEEDLIVPKTVYHICIYDDKGNYKPYTPLYSSKNTLSLAIKLYPNGLLSPFICGKNIGDSLVITKPSQRRDCKLNEFKNVLMIAAGTGITPMFQILKDQISSGLNKTDFTLLFLNYTDNDIFLLNELESLKKKSNGKLQITHILSKGTETPDSQHINGILTKDSLLTITRSKMFEYVYICGPLSLYDTFCGRKKSINEQGELTGVLKEIGYNETNVYKF